MEIKLNRDDRVRVDGSCYSLNNFADIDNLDDLGLGVTFFSSFCYIEVRRRKKDNLIKVFTFPKKSLKKEFDFGVWSDAEVILSINDQFMHKS